MISIDLPKLKTIDSRGWSFHEPRSLTLESISENWILMVFRYSKSSKCQATLWLVWSSIPGSSIEINFEYCLIDLISFIDVSPILADLVEINSDSDYDYDSEYDSDSDYDYECEIY